MPTEQKDDKRLDRLLDYTKFHIGIYLSAAGGLVALLGVSAKPEEKSFFANLVGCPVALFIAFLLMAVAGLAGGLIASSCTECVTHDELWKGRQGPFDIPIFTGRVWARIEHAAFWLSALFFSYSILSAPEVRDWLWTWRGIR